MFMSGQQPRPARRETRETARELGKRLGLFSFQDDGQHIVEFAAQDGATPELGIRPGGVVEWLVSRPGAGALTAALSIMARSKACGGKWAIVDPAGECYLPAFSGWGIDLDQILLVRPSTLQESSWAIEQCLRCPGITATWAWVDQVIHDRVRRRWQLAAEVGTGVGLFFRPAQARRDPTWADLRLLVTPESGGQGEERRMRIEVLYRRGGRGGSTQAWEINHATGHVHLASQVAAPATAKRAAPA
jgi:hypothetical protein